MCVCRCAGCGRCVSKFRLFFYLEHGRLSVVVVRLWSCVFPEASCKVYKQVKSHAMLYLYMYSTFSRVNFTGVCSVE